MKKAVLSVLSFLGLDFQDKNSEDENKDSIMKVKEDGWQTKLKIYLDEMDHDSQKLLQKISFNVIISVAIVSFIIAYLLQSFQVCVISILVAFGICTILFVPGWPMWKRNEIKWLEKARD
ncbi:hypothetical protein PPERSA_04367 [Pseudocohnilembus persalinus]|uniref:Signal peptidase complex subunit 1 n=1 Tax=Pseudocohnilembus persalinus TaxID=266149 RepID=A0A0V0QRB6_PSEPJ|nr:hypothetical protein PPERSA_04367 [Pseudocohnilembus persalinus]|eukprot:KRX04552.1 hypothetical protein PPERSA_04367 [Pseudocohnilembus persalinus]